MISCVQHLLDDGGAGRGLQPGVSGYLKLAVVLVLQMCCEKQVMCSEAEALGEQH